MIVNTECDLVLYFSSPEKTSPPEGSYSWNRLTTSTNVTSLLDLVEDNSHALRAEYFQWLDDLQSTTVKGGDSIISLLTLETGSSLWWFNNLVENSPYKIPLSDVFRFLALRHEMALRAPKKMKIIGGNYWKNAIAIELCRSMNVLVESNFPRHRTCIYRIKNSFFIFNIATLFRACGSIAKIFFKSSWRKTRADAIVSKDSKTIFFCNYLVGKAAASPGEGARKYWGLLLKLLSDLRTRSDWLHLYVSDDLTPSKKDVRKGMLKHQSDDRLDVHSILQDQISRFDVLAVAAHYCRFLLRQRRVREVLQASARGNHSFLYTVLFEQIWSSIYGPHAIASLAWRASFKNYFAQRSKMSLGFYLFENQPWETALLEAWHEAGNGEIVGVPHAAVRFWDLRFFSGTLGVNEAISRPTPSKLAANGRVARDLFIQSGYPQNKILDLEALRYTYLNKYANIEESSGDFHDKGKPRILVLGDYTEKATRQMLDCLSKAFEAQYCNAELIMRFHPKCTIPTTEYPSLTFNVSDLSLEADLCRTCAVYSSNLTSAALDAFLFGSRIAVFKATDTLNYSPLLGAVDVDFVSNADDLGQFLSTVSPDFVARNRVTSGYLDVDESLAKWSALIEKPLH